MAKVNVSMRDTRHDSRKSVGESFDNTLADQIRKIDLIEMEAWSAWERSQQTEVTDTQTVKSTQVRSLKTKQKRVRGRVGDPRFLKIALDCVEKRCRIMGVDRQNKSGSDEIPFGILVVVENADQSDQILSYVEFERARALVRSPDS